MFDNLGLSLDHLGQAISGLSLLIRSVSLAGYLELARELDLPATALLRRVGLNREMLDQPDHPIRLDAVCRLPFAGAERKPKRLRDLWLAHGCQAAPGAFEHGGHCDA